MRRLDTLHLQYPCAGIRLHRDLLRLQVLIVGRKHVVTLMRRMWIEALYQRPRATQPHPGHRVFSYLLRDREITAPNQVWAMDITYTPMRRGFLYLAVVLDWATRRVMAWRLSNTMTTDCCFAALAASVQHGHVRLRQRRRRPRITERRVHGHDPRCVVQCDGLFRL